MAHSAEIGKELKIRIFAPNLSEIVSHNPNLSSEIKMKIILFVLELGPFLFAALMHRVQHEDPAKQHCFCPPGDDSWCGWQVEKAGGEQYTARDTLPYAVFEVIKSIWLQLRDKSLLEKCVRGATQNRNEAWNGMLWGFAPRPSFWGQMW